MIYCCSPRKYRKLLVCFCSSARTNLDRIWIILFSVSTKLTCWIWNSEIYLATRNTRKSWKTMSCRRLNLTQNIQIKLDWFWISLILSSKSVISVFLKLKSNCKRFFRKSRRMECLIKNILMNAQASCSITLNIYR